MQTNFFIALNLGLLAALPTLHAQNTGASQLVDTVQQRQQLEAAAAKDSVQAPELYAGETADLGPQSVVKMKAHRWHFEAAGDAEYFYTDNMLLTTRARQSADVLVSTVQATLTAPPQTFLAGSLTPRLGYQHQWFTYGLLNDTTIDAVDFGSLKSDHPVGLNTFDFNAQTIFGDLVWTRDNWTFTAGLDYRRLLDSGSYDEFYHEYVLNWGVQKNFPLTAKLAAVAGYQGDYRLTDSIQPPSGFNRDLNDRTDHSVFAALNFSACRYVLLQPYYRFQFSHYTGSNRDDFLNSLGLALYLPLTRNVSLRTFINYDLLSTDGKFVQDYSKFDCGGGLNLTVRF